MSDIGLFTRIGDRVSSFFGNLSEKKEKRLVRLSISFLEGEAGEEDINRFAKRFDIEASTVAAFVYFELMKRGINDLANHDYWVNEGDIIGKRMAYDIDFIRYGINDFSNHVARGIKNGEEIFSEAESIARDFDLGNKEVNLAVKEKKRVVERIKIYSEIKEICEDFNDEIRAQGKSLSNLPEELEDYGVEDIKILINNMEKENKIDPMASPSEAMGHASWAPEHVSDASDREWEKLEELLEKRRRALGKKAERIDELVKELQELAEDEDKARRDLRVVDEYNFVQELKSYEVSEIWKRQRGRHQNY